MAANITGSPFAAFFPGMLLAVPVVVVVVVVVVASHLLRITARQRKKLFRSFFSLNALLSASLQQRNCV